MTDQFEDDSVGYLTALGLGALIPDVLEQRDLPGVCDGGVFPGAETAFDQCGTECPGLWWVRIGRLFPSADFPNPDIAQHNKRPILLAQEYEVGLVRGMDVPDNGEAPDLDVLKEASRVQMADMRALLDVICSFFKARKQPFVIGDYTPYGPEGACVGGSWLATAGTRGIA